jgi:hypothetical protein
MPGPTRADRVAGISRAAVGRVKPLLLPSVIGFNTGGVASFLLKSASRACARNITSS